MRRRLLVTSAIAVGTGVLVAGSVALAQDEDDGGWFTDAIEELVADGTLTPAQAEAVEDALREARPDRPFGGRHGPGGRGALGMHIDLDDAADVIGIDDDELFDALRDGQTIAEVAEANGVDPQEVVDALTAEVEARLDELVADGQLDEDAAAERLENATERLTEVVNEGLPEPGRGRWPHPDDADEDTADTTETTDGPPGSTTTTTTG